MQGVYWIINWLNLKRYIGSAKDMQDRWEGHLKELRRNKHGSPYLQYAWNKYVPVYGEEIFVFEIIEVIVGDRKAAYDKEQTYLDKWFPTGLLYNIARTAGGGNLGEEANQKREISRQKYIEVHGHPRIGMKHTEETKSRIGNANRGRVKTTEAKIRHSQSLKETWRSVTPERYEELCKANSEARRRDWANGRVWSNDPEKTKTKIGDIHSKPYPAYYNEQTGERIPAGNNLARMCRDRKLPYEGMRLLRAGKTKITKRSWRLEL